MRHNAGNGPSASSLVELFQLNLSECLRDDRYDSVSAHEMARQLINLIFSTADLGYMLVDMKPDNIVVDMSGPDPRVRLIDLDPNYVRDVSMDIDSPASNELRAKQQNIVKPKGGFPRIESQIFYVRKSSSRLQRFHANVVSFGSSDGTSEMGMG